MPVRHRKILLLDLDGTLVDPAEGIVASARYALQRMGVATEPDEDLTWLIGPSIRISFARLLAERGGRTDPADVEAAVAHYRERYAAWGLTRATPYPGMRETLTRRRAAGDRLILCTAKAQPFAEKVVAHFGFDDLLHAVYGPGLDGRLEHKAELMAHLLAAEGIDPGQACMIGDREHDILAARHNGVASIGVLWGYGDRDELANAGADLIIDRPEELLG
ncbi:HAD hydrolase-like protein [Caulobacter sp. KR2-114]|uniref:HAD hydrolase-like protein n=1 Tax=Caulobacter sp. KR2-114 TaxID=3400912 RepID=UPI003C11B54A